MKLLFASVALALLALPAIGQTCAPPAIVANAKSANMFSPEQEMVLGELSRQRLANEFRPLRDARLLAYIENIGARLVKHLPPTGLKFTFHIIEYPAANAFNIPGGHVFLTRKLIALANTEDELASVIAHELGHAAVHHSATDISEAMRRILKIESLGDSKDVSDKYNLLIENARTRRRGSSRGGHENAQQIEADNIGFYAMVAAGYDPDATFTFFDRLTESEGKTGSWFSELFGTTRPAQKRLREIAQSTKALPTNCRDGRENRPTEDFLKWQAEVVMFRDDNRKELLPGLVWKKEISPKLRSDISHLAFSADGKMLLAQDDFSITVIDRHKPEVLLQIPVDEAEDAKITPDGKYVVFMTENLRFERWDIVEKKPVEARELIIRQSCWEHSLSPNGNYLACVDQATGLKILDTKTGKRVWEKEKFYPLTGFEYISWLFRRTSDSEYDVGFFRIGFSPDSKYVIFSRSNKYRFRIRIDMMAVAESENTAVAVDLTAMKPVDLGGDLKKVAARPFAFLDSSRVIGATEPKLEAAGVYSFPNGKRIQKLAFGAEEVKMTGGGDFTTIKPLTNARLGLFDVKRNAVVLGMDKAALAIHGNVIAIESVSGKILLREATYSESDKGMVTKDIGTIDLPVASISGMRAAEVSENFGWLVMSSKTRGGIWNLSSGERTIFTRGFNSAIVDGNGISVADFPKFRNDEHTLALLNSKTGQASPIRPLPTHGARQYGRFVLTRESIAAKAAKADGEKPQFVQSEEEDAESKLQRDVTFELKDWMQDKVVWTREFAGSVPRYSFDDYSGRLIFYWRLSTEEGKAMLKANPAVQAQATTLGNREGDYLIEVVDAFEQKTIAHMLLETGRGSFSVRGRGKSEGDWLMLNDSEGRVLVYSLKTGELRHRFFGNHASINPRRQQIAVENFPGELTLYDLSTGAPLAHYVVKGDIVFLRFSLTGNRLFVFNDGQTAYNFDLDKLPPRTEKQIIF
ncbi:MAG TPA: M48 family metalloprotease [Pyrinomonadaceae bacterium]|nr:M48 family metalloprotease [Pyrinomonadaceae bacterium]